MYAIDSISRKLVVLFAVLSSEKLAACHPITNSDLNDHIREFSSRNHSINSTGINTLQKEDSGRLANFSPVRNPVRFKISKFLSPSHVVNLIKITLKDSVRVIHTQVMAKLRKDVSDSALSSSSYSRGLLPHEHPGYILHEYEESPPIYGYEYQAGPDHHGFQHHAPHYHGHHGGHHDINYHHKHYDHALAAKAFLWPIAGIALLGAAAAFVSNPVLLQLGVVSGRRKRRDTEEILDTQVHTELNWLKPKHEEQPNEDSELVRRLLKKDARTQSNEMILTHKYKSNDEELKHRLPMKDSVKQEPLFKKLRVRPTVQSDVEMAVNNPRRFSNRKNIKGNKLIPVPLIVNKSA